jgi:hypothetical protein
MTSQYYRRRSKIKQKYVSFDELKYLLMKFGKTYQHEMKCK